MLLVQDQKACAGKSDDEIIEYLMKKSGLLMYQSTISKIIDKVVEVAKLANEDHAAFKEELAKRREAKLAALAGKKSIKQ